METGERRQFKRLNLSVEVLCRKHPVKILDKAALSRNISQGGICLIVYEEMSKGQMLELEFRFPRDMAPVKALGRVVWTSEFTVGQGAAGRRLDVGVEFIKINQGDLEKVNNYVFAHLPVK